ncbi:MAG: RsmB/NOP family class I SAM-dependent RNA methyltransferase [Lentisphaeria bacterium]
MNHGISKNNERRLPMPSSRVETQAKVGAGFVVQCLEKTFWTGKPSDRCLRDVFYANHQLGSRDRRIISETLFSVLRWWGWLKTLAPEEFFSVDKEWIRNQKVPQDEHAPQRCVTNVYKWYGCLAASWALENRLDFPPSVAWWCRQRGVNPENFKALPDGAPLKDRRRYLPPFFSKDDVPAFPEEDLVPEWTEKALSEPIPFLKLIDWLQHRPPVWLRGQTGSIVELCHNLQHNEVKVHPHKKMLCALKIQGAAANLRNLDVFRKGQFEFQDLASQAVGYVCAPKPGEQWWDCCAGGGGKTLQLAWLMEEKGSVLASDIRTHKLTELKLRARRAQFPNIRYKEWKGKEMPRFRNRFDGVLVDTACSCSGTWRRNPDARWTTTPEELKEFADLQLQLLTNASQGVVEGGTLVYSTCSMFACENQDIVNTFLAAHPEFKLAPYRCPVTGRETEGMNQIWPWDGDCDAMFTAKMWRSSAE